MRAVRDHLYTVGDRGKKKKIAVKEKTGVVSTVKL